LRKSVNSTSNVAAISLMLQLVKSINYAYTAEQLQAPLQVTQAQLSSLYPAQHLVHFPSRLQLQQLLGHGKQ
jgi:hypothetical protein